MAALVEPLGLERDVSRAVELLERLQRSGELPPQKLQALQRVLQSRFCSAIRESVEGEHHEKAVELLKAAQGSVKLVVRYTPRVLEEMEARFEKMRSARRRQQHHSYSSLESRG